MSFEAAMAVFFGVVEEINRRFPHLCTTLIQDHAHVDAMLEIHEQQGLLFAVSINLQGDELHLNAGEFRCEWFPCSKDAVVAWFLEAVCGLLAGDMRIVEYKRGDLGVRAILQRCQSGKWRRVASSFSTAGLILWGAKKSVLQNIKSPSGANPGSDLPRLSVSP